MPTNAPYGLADTNRELPTTDIGRTQPCQSAHQDMRLMLTAVTQQRNLIAGQDLSVQRHLPDAPVDAGCIFHADLINGFVVAVRHLVARPTKPGKVADKPAQAAQPTGLWVFVQRLWRGKSAALILSSCLCLFCRQWV